MGGTRRLVNIWKLESPFIVATQKCHSVVAGNCLPIPSAIASFFIVLSENNYL